MQDCKTSIIDLPKTADQEDLLGIDRYKTGLVKFIDRSNTPITIALQGEWGSGKTSLMNTLKNELCDADPAKFIPVWLNTWQYSLMKDSESALISIIRGLTDEIISNMDDLKSQAAMKVRSVFGKVLKTTAKVAIQATTGNDIGDSLDSWEGNKETTILALRNELNAAIKMILEKKQKAGFIFFIDDLDRIDPPVAVQILELLKNIFDLDKCVFVLAIDYDVVIKGLEPKFGKFTEANEREFRSFFDKIIQLPFSMPVATYDINSFLIKSLHDIGYIDDQQAKDEEYIATLSEITRLTVGTNPRSLKRLLNSLSLISCVNDDNEEETEDSSNEKLLVNYAVVNIQIAYPTVYMLLVKRPDFTSWDDKFALEINLPALSKEVEEKLALQEEFDETWEQVLYRFCEKDYYLKSCVILISQLLNSLRSSLSEAGNIGELIEQALSNSSVTNVAAFDKPVVAMNTSAFLKTMVKLLIPELNKTLNGITKATCPQKRFEKNALFVLGQQGKLINRVRYSPVATPNGIRIALHTERGIVLAKSKNFHSDMIAYGLTETVSAMERAIDDFCAANPVIKRSRPKLDESVWKWKNHWVIVIKLELVIRNAEDIKSTSNLNELSKATTFLYQQLQILNEIYSKHVG